MENHSSPVGVFLLAENRLLLDVFARLLSRKSDIQVIGAAAIETSLGGGHRGERHLGGGVAVVGGDTEAAQ